MNASIHFGCSEIVGAITAPIGRRQEVIKNLIRVRRLTHCHTARAPADFARIGKTLATCGV
jgi:hypothetical protein